MVNGIIIYAVVMVLIIVGLFVWLLLLLYREKQDYENNPIIVNFNSKYSNKSFIGIQTEVIEGKNGRLHIRYIPKDYDVRNMNSKETEIIVEPKKVVSLSMGSLSGDRYVKMILPRNPEDLSEELKDHDFFKSMMMFTEMKNAIKTEIDTLREGANRRDNILLKMGDRQLSSKFIQDWEESIKDMVRSITKEELRSKGMKTSVPPHLPHQ